MPTRRQVLWGIGSTLGVVSGVFAWRFVRSKDVDAVVMILRKRLHYLKLDEEGMQRFALDLSESKQVSTRKLRFIPAIGALYDHLPDSRNFLLDAIRHGEERVVSSFLLSSDFFTHGSDDSRVINYLGMYDPLRACGTPFARPISVASS
jgi:hypothetical protein